MKPLTTSLGALAIGGILAGTALAGPNDAYPGFSAASAPKKTEHVTIGLFRAGPKAKAEEKTKIPSAKPKAPAVAPGAARSK